MKIETLKYPILSRSSPSTTRNQRLSSRRHLLFSSLLERIRLSGMFSASVPFTVERRYYMCMNWNGFCENVMLLPTFIFSLTLRYAMLC